VSSSHADHRPTISSTAEHLHELFAEDAAADCVQEEVDGDSADVQQLRVVAGDQHRRPVVDVQRTIQLELDEVDDEVKQNGQISQHVAGRDRDEHDRCLQTSLLALHNRHVDLGLAAAGRLMMSSDDGLLSCAAVVLTRHLSGRRFDVGQFHVATVVLRLGVGSQDSVVRCQSTVIISCCNKHVDVHVHVHDSPAVARVGRLYSQSARPKPSRSENLYCSLKSLKIH